MTGSHALDVIIILIFIYLFYSLLASIIGEILASFLGTRARNLKFTISRMLTDGPAPQKTKIEAWGQSFAQDILSLVSNPKGVLVRKFYESPSVRYLAKDNFQSSPSYISSDVFSETLMNLLTEGIQGDTELEKLQQRLELIQPGTQLVLDEQHLIDLREVFEQKGENLEAFEVWMKNAGHGQPQKWVEDGLLEPQTKKHLATMLKQSQNDIDRFQGNLELWFDHTMDRCKGWYKKKSGVMMLIIGIGIAASFNVDTVQLVQKLGSDEDMVAQAMVKIEEVYGDTVELKAMVNDPENKGEEIRDVIEDMNITLGLGWGEDQQAHWKCHCWSAIAGWLLTALAISLGAPFWFDLLNKFMRLRSSLPRSGTNTSGSTKSGNSAERKEEAEA